MRGERPQLEHLRLLTRTADNRPLIWSSARPMLKVRSEAPHATQMSRNVRYFVNSMR